MSKWYVFKVITGSEEKLNKIISKELEKEIGFVFVPMVEYKLKFANEIKTELKPMFPGYILAESDDIYLMCKSIKQKFIDCKILTNSDGEITPLHQHEVDFLMQFSDKDNCVRASQGFKENDKVVITKGPLLGKEALIKKVNRNKRIAIIEVSLMGEIRRVTVGLEILSGDG